jgi:hypothetical protein
MRDPYLLVALSHAWDAAALTRRRAEELYGLRVAMIDLETATSEDLAERTKELSPGKAPLEETMAIFLEVLANYGFRVEYDPAHQPAFAPSQVSGS